MFRRILIPTDGSAIAAKAVRAGMQFAKETGAKVTGYHALEMAPGLYYGDGLTVDQRLLDSLDRGARAAGRRYMAAMAKAAKVAGVEFDSLMTKAGTPDEGIIAAARKRRCDAVFIASHGRRGLKGLLLGSVTHKVLTRSTIPVVVYR